MKTSSLTYRLLASTFTFLGAALQPNVALAQIAPDDTLGNESSVVTPDVQVQGDLADLIEGGAERGGNLFHSFEDFNVLAGERVYFANPGGIESILSRVTGGDPSNLFGTLGVDGAADLFLVNPNGIVFGENVQLDVEGSFYATTADGIPLGDAVFSAVTPEQSPLLTVNPGTGFLERLHPESGDVVNRGQLAAGEDLTLAARNLDLQGQIAAVGDVSLLAVDTVQIRDTPEHPFIALAGNDLLVQGNEQVDIVALSHPDSGLFSDGNMVLRSATPVRGDAHYLSGGTFQIQQLDQSLGNLYSPYDPIIRSQGDVSFFAYQGASLHVLSGGAVDIGTIVITGPDTTGAAIGPDTTPDLANVILSDGTSLTIDGSQQPIVDIRAGVDPTVLGTPLGTVGAGIFRDSSFQPVLPPENNPIATSADITVGDVLLNAPNGLVLLTNQYEPSSTLLAGNIMVNGEGILPVINGIEASGIEINGPETIGQGGVVYLDARDDISVVNSTIITSGAGEVGDIVLLAEGNVTFDGSSGETPVGAVSRLEAQGTGGNVRIAATNLEAIGGNVVFASGRGSMAGMGDVGDVVLDIEETVRLEGGASLVSITLGTGDSGDVRITARDLEVFGGSQISASTSGTGDAGDVVIELSNNAYFDGFRGNDDPMNPIIPSIATSAVFGQGDGGMVRLTAANVQLTDGAQLNTAVFSEGEGNAGDVILTIAETTRFEGTAPNGNPSGAFSNLEAGGQGQGGIVMITAENLEVLSGAQITALTLGEGNAGNVILTIAETARFEGTDSAGKPSGAFSNLEAGGQGQGGIVMITAENLEVLGGAQVGAATLGEGNAGDVILTIAETARFEGANPVFDNRFSGAFSSVQENGEGQGGDLRITAENLVLNEARLRADSLADASDTGEITLTVRDQLQANDSTIATNSVSTDGGDIAITADDILLSGDSDIQTNVDSGDGTGGDIRITADTVVAFGDSDILTFAPDGRGGDITLDTPAFFGENYVPGAPPNPEFDGNGRVDINANGALEDGSILAPDTEFISSSLTELPEVTVDTDTLLSTSCIARVGPQEGSFTVTGTGGLPQLPNDPVVSSFPTGTVRTAASEENTAFTAPRPWQPGQPLTEADGVYQLPDGRLVTSQACEEHIQHVSTETLSENITPEVYLLDE